MINFIKSYLRGIIFLLLRFVSHIPSHSIRLFILRFFFRLKIDNKSLIYSGFIIRKPSKLKIGKNSVVGFNCELDARKGLLIGDNVNISSDVKIYTLQHDYNSKNFDVKGAQVFIKDYSWISANVIILPGVTIGKGAVVAAGAVVTKSVNDFDVVAGIPAKKIAVRNRNLKYNPASIFLPFN